MQQFQILGVIAAIILCSTGAYGNDCHLLPDSGSCENSNGKEEIRYYYSSVNMKCTEFPYSGCGGNANNFKDVEECKRKCGTTNLPVIAQIVSAQAELKCWYGNKTYAVGESIPEATTDNPCSMGCFCSATAPGKPPKITCATVDCQPYPDQDDCVPTHTEGSCCPEYYCPQPGQNETVHKCKYNGKEYVEGQTIYPDDYPCVTCACNKNFKGVLSTEGGVCKEVNCGLQVHNQANIVKGCIPKFFTTSKGRQSCCPIEWNCNNVKPQSSPPQSPQSRR